MTTAAFDLALWTIIFFIVGMIKPKWPLFFLKSPDRFLVAIITTVLVMVTMTLFGEGARRDKLAKEALTAPAASQAAPNAQVAVPVPVPTPAPAAPPAHK
jgi:hypothetical protein